MMIVKVDNGRLCGGYCSIGWKSHPYGSWQHDNNSFVFSLDLLKKYNESQQGHSGHVFLNPNYGPYFGDNGSLGLYSTMNQANSGYCRINQPSLTVPVDSQS